MTARVMLCIFGIFGMIGADGNRAMAILYLPLELLPHFHVDFSGLDNQLTGHSKHISCFLCHYSLYHCSSDSVINAETWTLVHVVILNANCQISTII